MFSEFIHKIKSIELVPFIIYSVLALVCAALFLSMIDSVSLDDNPVVGHVVDKRLKPQQIHLVNKVHVIQPRSAYLIVELDSSKEQVQCKVTEKRYLDSVIGESVVAMVASGRYSGDVYCSGIH